VRLKGNMSGHAKLCMRGGRGWQRRYSYIVAPSPAVMVTAVTLVAKQSLTTERQQQLLKAFLAEDGSKINPKPNVVTSSDGSQMVTETNNVA